MVNVNKERLVLAIPIAIWRAYDKSVDSWMQHSESVDEIKENSKMFTMIIQPTGILLTLLHFFHRIKFIIWNLLKICFALYI